MGLAPIFVERVFETIVETNQQSTTILLVEQNAMMALEWRAAATSSRPARWRSRTKRRRFSGTNR
jgi:hypothetical protein